MATFNPLTGVTFDDAMDIPSYEEMMKPYISYKAQYDKDEADRDTAQIGLAKYLPYIGDSGKAYDAYQKLQGDIDVLTKYIGTPLYQKNRDLFTDTKKRYAETTSMFENAKSKYEKALEEDAKHRDSGEDYQFRWANSDGSFIDRPLTINDTWGTRVPQLYAVSGKEADASGMKAGKALTSRVDYSRGWGSTIGDAMKTVQSKGRNNYSGVDGTISVDMLLDPNAHQEEWEAWKKVTKGHYGDAQDWLYKNMTSGEIGTAMRNYLAGTQFDKLTDDQQERIVKRFMKGVYDGLSYKETRESEKSVIEDPTGKRGSDENNNPFEASIIDEGLSFDEEKDFDNKNDFIQNDDGSVTDAEIEKEKARVRTAIPFEIFNKELTEGVPNTIFSKILNSEYSLGNATKELIKDFGLNDGDFIIPNSNTKGSNRYIYDGSKVAKAISEKIKQGNYSEEKLKEIYNKYTTNLMGKDFIKEHEEDIKKRTERSVNMAGNTTKEKIENQIKYDNAIKRMSGKSASFNGVVNGTLRGHIDKWCTDATVSLGKYVDENHNAIWFNKTLKDEKGNDRYGIFEFDGEAKKITGNEKGISKSEFEGNNDPLTKHLTDLRLYNGYLTMSDERNPTKRYIVITNNETINNELKQLQVIDKCIKNKNGEGGNFTDIKPVNITDTSYIDNAFYSQKGNRDLANELYNIKEKTPIGQGLYAVRVPFEVDGRQDQKIIIFKNDVVLIDVPVSDILYNEGRKYQSQYLVNTVTHLSVFKQFATQK